MGAGSGSPEMICSITGSRVEGGAELGATGPTVDSMAVVSGSSEDSEGVGGSGSGGKVVVVDGTTPDTDDAGEVGELSEQPPATTTTASKRAGLNIV